MEIVSVGVLIECLNGSLLTFQKGSLRFAQCPQLLEMRQYCGDTEVVVNWNVP